MESNKFFFRGSHGTHDPLGVDKIICSSIHKLGGNIDRTRHGEPLEASKWYDMNAWQQQKSCWKG